MEECNETCNKSHNEEEETLLNDFKKVIDDLKRDIKTFFKICHNLLCSN